MNIHSILILFSLISTLTVTAQTNNCNCFENLDRTIQKTEENYAGYPAKVNAVSAPAYTKLVQSLKQIASKETNPKRCYYIIRNYVKYFKDKHFIIAYNNSEDFDSTVVAFSELQFRNGLLKTRTSPIEGIWINPEGTTKVAIQKSNDGTFKALKIESATDSFLTGFVYFTLVPDGNQYIVKEYNSFISTDFPAKQSGNLL